MNTKLVYALTCDECGTYIEQALISIFSARYHNPQAHIVLLTDNKTNQLLVDKRGEINTLITEKIVIDFEDDTLSALYRSRWLKTSARRLVRGNLLYIDCDTVIQRSLDDIDQVDGDMVMVYDAHMTVAEYTPEMFDLSVENCAKLGFDATSERYYYNGGVILVKDSEIGNKLFDFWHEEWKKGTEIQFYGDEPSLMKSNALLGYVITRLSDEWNCQVFMSPLFMPNSYILHYWCLKNRSFIFAPKYLQYIKINGLTDYAKETILHSTDSMLPFVNYYSTYKLEDYLSMPMKYGKVFKDYAKNIDPIFEQFPLLMVMSKLEKKLLLSGFFYLVSISIMMRNLVKYKVLRRGINKSVITCAP